MSTPSNREILLAYRQLYKHCLRAVQYSKPARYTIRDRLRHRFRSGQPADLDLRRIDNTLEFLRGAAREKGLEHHIVKNLTHVWYHEPKMVESRTKGDDGEVRVKMTAYDPFYHTIRMLNESMGMCIR